MTNLLLSSELLLIPQSSLDQVSTSKNQRNNIDVALVDNSFYSFEFISFRDSLI